MKRALRAMRRVLGWVRGLRRFDATPGGTGRPPVPFPGSQAYWEERYRRGGNSGDGSYGRLSMFKAEVLNGFVAGNRIESVLEFGCGDGNQLDLAEYPRYLGFDVSPRAVELCRKRFASDPTKSFRLMQEYAGERVDLTLSLDVIYHLVEDPVFERYMEILFDAALRYVIIYSSNIEDNRGNKGRHVRHRRFSDWIALERPTWKLVRRIPNRYPYHGDNTKGSFADFYVYQRT